MAKQFSWSFSRLKSDETCPKRHYEVDIAKNYSDGEGHALVWGSKVHEAFAEALTKRTPLPEEMKDYQKWIDQMAAGKGELLVEQKYAITKDFQPTEWFGPRAWLRGIADAVRIDGPVALAKDWKTGKSDRVDSTQLMLMAQCIFAFHPEVKKIKTVYTWLQEDCETEETYTRLDVADAWIGLLPRVEAYEEQIRSQSFPPKPGKLCYKWCPVISCPFHGKRH